LQFVTEEDYDALQLINFFAEFSELKTNVKQLIEFFIVNFYAPAKFLRMKITLCGDLLSLIEIILRIAQLEKIVSHFFHRFRLRFQTNVNGSKRRNFKESEKAEKFID
jgi:hypothetical protein